MLGIRTLFPLLIYLITPFLEVATTSAQNTSSPKPLPREKLKTTDELLNQVCNFLKAQPSFTVEMDVTYDNVLESGAKVQYSAYQKVWVRKPDRLRSDYVGDERETFFTMMVNLLAYLRPRLTSMRPKKLLLALMKHLCLLRRIMGSPFPCPTYSSVTPAMLSKSSFKSLCLSELT